MMHKILQQRENIFRTRTNELGAIPSSFIIQIILDLSKFLGFYHIFFSTFACIDKMSVCRRSTVFKGKCHALRNLSGMYILLSTCIAL